MSAEPAAESISGNQTASRPSVAGPQLLERTFSILRLFSAEQPEWTTTEAARACDLPVPTVYRILSSLERHGFVSRDEVSKRFRLGAAALELGRQARAVMDLRSVSLPVLGRLVRETGETALLTALNVERDRSVCLERVESTNALRLSVEPGRQMPLHAGASQKALLAFMPEQELDAVMSSPLERLCISTLTDTDALREDVAGIRQRGWATSYEETNLGVWGIAITLLDGRDDVVAAVGLAGPRVRANKDRVKQMLEVVSRGAADIASLLALRTSIEFAAGAKMRSKPRQMAAESR